MESPGTKTDNYLATGYTANGPHCINRGTPDPSDDVNILRGDAWVTVTSPREGTSQRDRLHADGRVVEPAEADRDDLLGRRAVDLPAGEPSPAAAAKR